MRLDSHTIDEGFLCERDHFMYFVLFLIEHNVITLSIGQHIAATNADPDQTAP